MQVCRISAVTLRVRDMQSSCRFYSRLPGFQLAHGGPAEPFTSYRIGRDMYFNLELARDDARDFGRVIFHIDEVDALFRQMKNDLPAAAFENEPQNAPWGERFFHVRDPDGYQLSFAKSL